MPELIHVVAGVLRDATGRILIAQRPPGKPLAGYWEFPGGKRLPGESDEQALARELAEELGVTIRGCRPLLTFRHDYGERTIELAVYRVEHQGEPAGLEAQALKWVAPAALGAEALLPADRPIVEALLAGESEDSALSGNAVEAR